MAVGQRNKQKKLPQIPLSARRLAGQVIEDWLWATHFTCQDGKKAEIYRKQAEKIQNCGRNFVHLEDSQAHIKVSRIHCNNEFCPRCGQNDSALHKKRVSRAGDRLLWSPLLGYMVFTLPQSISAAFPGKKVLNKLAKHAWLISKKNFDTDGGMSRVHFMGEQPEKLHIHFNVLFPCNNTTGKVEQTVLDKIRAEWTDVVNKEFSLSLEDTSVYYKFAVETGRQLHKIGYVLRPVVTPDKFITLPDEYRKKIVEMKGWHNTRWFGKLANSQYKKYLKEKDIVLPEKNDRLSPITNEKYEYKGIIPAQDVAGGYFTSKDGNVYQIRLVDNDTYVDYETYSYMKENNLLNANQQDKPPPV